MTQDRRQFLSNVGFLAAATATTAASASTSSHGSIPEDPMGVLVDTSVCVGCRLCEHACKKANGIEPGTLESYDDQSVFAIQRRPEPQSFTVINRHENPADASKPVFVKLNCMHCNYAACVSACIVGALRKKEDGSVTYDAWKCIGCRYCMVACPFQLPAYEYDDVLTPHVRKCQFCFATRKEADRPACVEACPRQALTFRKRDELVELAHEKIDAEPRKYVHHVYGEHEVGGTSWMYLATVPFNRLGFVELGTAAPPALTEAIQHGVFKHWIAPTAWYSFLGFMYWFTGRRARLAHGHSAAPACEKHHEHPAPQPRKLLTPGVWALISLVLIGVGFWIYRMCVGLAASTNLTQQRPWGLWIAMDVGSGIALAGGGFVAAAIFHVFHRERYHMLARSALVTALLGYTFYVPGLLADLGKWWNLPITMLPPMWQGNSVLFEVGMCVMIYLNVQYLELTPIVCERLLGVGWASRWPRLHRAIEFVKKNLDRVMPLLLCLGVALSTFHQSSLGNLLVIAPYKLHALWWSPLAPLHFLLSAIMVGLPMVIFTILFASWSLNREPEMDVLKSLARRYVPIFTAIYIAAKLADLIVRGTWTYLLDGSPESFLWIGEMLLVIVPLALLFVPRVTASPRWLAFSCLSIILGVVLNRLNVFVLAFHPPFATKPYIPSLTEFMVSLGLVAALLLVYRIMVTYLPILEPRPRVQEVAP